MNGEKKNENTAGEAEVKEEEKKEAPKENEKHGKKAEKEIESLKKELAELNDRYLRLAAEYDNFRKRSAKEKADAYTEAYSDAVKAFLPLADSLDKALEFSPGDEGIKALCKQFSDSCAKIGVTPIESDGQPFDPELHNAIMHEDDPEKGENTVAQTFCKGYTLNGKVIRHAMVKVVN
ncbi:MAG: nucleotide exchange factor GrpE [Clostridia bacterium]|nr:nucleotide exchange factor GrpE [Clostridia bacterium]